MRQIRLAILIVLGSVAGVLAVPAGPPAGSNILNSHVYQSRSEINIDTATVRNANISTFTNVPSLPLGIRLAGANYNSTVGSDVTPVTLNVKDFGAKGDGIIDDIIPIRNAVMAISSPTCGAVYFPHGTYAISDVIYWPGCVTLVGESEMGTILKLTGGFPSGHNIVQIRKPNGDYYTTINEPKNSTIRNFTIDGTGGPSGFTYGIAMDTVERGLIENCRIISTAKSGIYTGGINYTARQKYPTIRNVTMIATGWDGSADQIGGGGIYGASYSRVVCINSPGTCIDQVDTVAGRWDDVLSTGSTGGNGGLWSDFGMQNSQITNSRIYNSSIHIFGAPGEGPNGAPHNNYVAGNYLENGGLIVHSDDNANWTSGNRIIGNIFNSCPTDCMTIGYSSGTIIDGNSINNWSSSGGTNYGIQIYGINDIITNNYGVWGGYSVWLKQSAIGTGTRDLIFGNNFPNGATMNLDGTAPVSGVLNYVDGVITAQGVFQFGDGSLPSRIDVKTLTSGSDGPALTLEEQDTNSAERTVVSNGAYATDVHITSVTIAGSNAFNYYRGTNNNNNTTVWRIDGLGGYQFGTRTLTQLQSSTGNNAGTVYYCSNCSVTPICVSTGTAAGSFVEIHAKGTVCQ